VTLSEAFHQVSDPAADGTWFSPPAELSRLVDVSAEEPLEVDEGIHYSLLYPKTT
jgi:hypothetical protein